MARPETPRTSLPADTPLMPASFEHLLEPVGLASVFADQRGTIPCEIAEFSDRHWRHKASRTSPCSSSGAIQTQSLTSVFRPGTCAICAALASTHVNASSSR